MNWKQRNWGLKLGLLGAGRQATLAPSLSSLGRSTYLQPMDFIKTLGVALALHALVLTIASLWPNEKVTDIPVRALTFKIGAGQRIAVSPSDQASPVQPQPLSMTPQTPSQWRAAAPKPKPVAAPAAQPKTIPVVPRAERRTPSEQTVPPRTAPVPTPQLAIPRTALPDTSILTSQAAIAPSPQRFIREGTPAGTSLAATNESVQAVRARYEQEISSWIQRHKFYPQAAAGKEGRTVIRVRIDRTGYVRYYAIEESSGFAVLDAAAVDMIRRANPMPVVPATYPAGNLIEFLIPIVFRVPV